MVTKKTSKKVTKKKEESFEEKHMKEVNKKTSTKTLKPKNEKECGSLVSDMDAGLQNEINEEVKVWNERLYKTTHKGTPLDRFPLSPSQLGKCALALGRSVSHYIGLADYPRTEAYLQPRVKRIFNRGFLLEDTLIKDFEKYTQWEITDQQRRVRLPIVLAEGKRYIEGSLDGIAVNKEDGTRILLDFKSKGAFYSGGFNDSIQETFQNYRETGLVSESFPNTFLISDAWAFFNVMDLEDFFVDYLLQLNSYAFAEDVETGEKIQVDFCALFYENKNSCQNYELRWKPDKRLIEFAEEKMTFIYKQARKSFVEKKESDLPFDEILMTNIPKEFALGSARCKLCDFKDLCYGEYDPSTKPASHKMAELDTVIVDKFEKAVEDEVAASRAKQEILKEMAQQDATHFMTSDGMCYERRWYKGEKAFKLKHVRKPL